MKINDRNLKQLRELINSLTPYEVDLFKREHLPPRSRVSKMFNLFEFLVLNNKISYENTLSKISLGSSYSSFNKLISRLNFRIQEFLVSSVIEKQKDEYGEIFRTNLYIRKELLKYDILNSKGLYSLAGLKLSAVIKKSKEFEYYGDLLDALYRQFSYSKKVTKDNIEDYLEEIEVYESYRKKSLIAKRYYNVYKKYLIATSNIDSISYSLEKKIGELLRFAKDTNSANIYSYYYILAMEYCFKNGNIQEEINLGFNFIKLIKNSKAVFSKSRIGFIHSSISNSALSAGQFKLSFHLAEMAIKWIIPNDKVNLGTAYLLKVKSLIFLGRIKKVQIFINEINSNNTFNLIKYNKTHLVYYESVICFTTSEFKQSLNLFYELKELEKDKEGWNIWIQILRIQVYLELERFSETEYLIENLRKYLERNKDKYQLKDRLFLISKLLIELKTCNFDYLKAAEKKPEVLKQLMSLDKDCRWDGRTPEMILFHDWFNSKVKNKPYKPNFEPYRIDLKVGEAEFESI